MHRVIRCAFVGLLAVALVASGSVLRVASQAAAHGEAMHMHHASSGETDAGSAHAHHHHAQHQDTAAQDDAQQPLHDHASKTCCSMCTAASPLPPVAGSAVQFVTSRAEYASRLALGIALTIPVDPGIPKRTG